LEEVIFPHLSAHITSFAGRFMGANLRDRIICLQTLTLFKLAGKIYLEASY
jgi:hypothetical protein